MNADKNHFRFTVTLPQERLTTLDSKVIGPKHNMLYYSKKDLKPCVISAQLPM